MTTNKIKKIRASYEPKQITQFDELKKLDKRVNRPAKIFAYLFGCLSCLVLGTGMSLAMQVIGASLSFGMTLGIAIGLLGILLVSVNYSIYKIILNARKKRYAEKIIQLSDSLLNN